MRQTMGIVVLMLLAIMAGSALAEDAPAMWFEPTDGSCDCGEDTTVDLMINTSVNEIAMQADIYFDPSCVNITDIDYTGTPWDFILAGGWTHNGDFVRLGTGIADQNGIPPGVYKAATLTVECLCPSGQCASQLGIVDAMPGLSIYNTTITCNTSDERDDEPCLGDCFEDLNCSYMVASNVTCYDCIGIIGQSWVNYPCPISACNCTCDSMCWTECPECCDGIDNDGMNGTDWPDDPKCACCIDQTETVDDGCSVPCVPELPTFALAGLGILGIGLLARKRD